MISDQCDDDGNDQICTGRTSGIYTLTVVFNLHPFGLHSFNKQTNKLNLMYIHQLYIIICLC